MSSRWQDMAESFALLLDEAKLHHDPKARALYIVNARRLLQQFTASANIAIGEIEDKPGGAPTQRSSNDQPARRDPYRDD